MSELPLELSREREVEIEAQRRIYSTRDRYQADLDSALREVRAGGSLTEMEHWTKIARFYYELIRGLDEAVKGVQSDES